MEKRAIWHDTFGNRIRSTTDGVSTDFTYIRGNLLAGVDSNVLYEYNKDGARFQKTVDGVVTKYFLDGHRIMGENRGTDIIRYFYDIDGLCGIRYNGQNYNVVRDALGNVVAITQGVEIRARYEYDSLGNCKVYNFGNSTIGDVNPFRWKGHYFDTETGFYYINGRYYDPQTASFLDAESVSAVFANSGNPLALDRNGIACVNTFAFAINTTNVFTHLEMFADTNYDINANKPWWEIAWNAVVNWFNKTLLAISNWYNNLDSSVKTTIAVGLAIVGTILVAGAITVLTAGIGWAFMATTMAGAILHGAAVGTLIGAGIGMVAGGIIGGAASDWSIEGILTGMGIGFGGGAIIGAIVGGSIGALQYTNAVKSWGATRDHTPKENMIRHFKKHVIEEGHDYLGKNVVQYTRNANKFKKSISVFKTLDSGSLSARRLFLGHKVRVIIDPVSKLLLSFC